MQGLASKDTVKGPLQEAPRTIKIPSVEHITGTSPGDVGRSPGDFINRNQGMYTSLFHQPQGSTNPEIPNLISPMTKLTFQIPCPTQVEILPQVAQLQLKMYDCPDQVGGRLKFFLPNWRKLTNDPWILEVITGFNVQLTSPPHQFRDPFHPRFSNQECLLLSQEVVERLNKGAVEKTNPDPDQFLGHLFLRPKKDG